MKQDLVEKIFMELYKEADPVGFIFVPSERLARTKEKGSRSTH
jgi:hypothetical protein